MTYLEPTSYPVLLGAISAAAGAAILGVFLILRRMALVADAFSHVALPGIALGLLFHFSPAVGAFVMLAFGVVLMVKLENFRRVPPDTALGVIFTASLAIGLLLIPDEGILESLFGDITKLTLASAIITITAGLLLVSLTLLSLRSFTLITLSSDLAHTSGINVKRTRYFFFLLVAFAVSIGIQFMGVLLMGALIVFPAAIAKNFSGSLRVIVCSALAVAVTATLIGLPLANRLHSLPGPTVVLVLVGLFIVSLFIPKKI